MFQPECAGFDTKETNIQLFFMSDLTVTKMQDF